MGIQLQCGWDGIYSEVFGNGCGCHHPGYDHGTGDVLRIQIFGEMCIAKEFEKD